MMEHKLLRKTMSFSIGQKFVGKFTNKLNKNVITKIICPNIRLNIHCELPINCNIHGYAEKIDRLRSVRHALTNSAGIGHG